MASQVSQLQAGHVRGLACEGEHDVVAVVVEGEGLGCDVRLGGEAGIQLGHVADQLDVDIGDLFREARLLVGLGCVMEERMNERMHE